MQHLPVSRRRPPTPALASASALLALAVSACAGGRAGGGGGPVDVAQFPTKQELAAVSARPLPVVKDDVHADVASWSLVGPLPDRIGDAPLVRGKSALHDLALATVPDAATSENVACAAQQLAHFLNGNDNGMPEARLKSWLFARCGVTAHDLAMEALTWTKVPASMSDDEVWRDARAQLQEVILRTKTGGGPVGVGFARDADAGTAALVVAGGAEPAAKLVPTPQVLPPAQASAVVEGALLADAEVVYAFATKGLLDAAECDADLAVALPRFRFTCPVDGSDAIARIDVGALRKGRVLGDSVATVLVVRDPQAASAYREAVYVAGDATAGDVLAQVNAVRAAAGKRPLAAMAKQSEQVKQVAPHYFANLFAKDRDPHIEDVVALGLMAGWDVTELTIHDAGFAILLDMTGGGDDLLGYALDHPLPRAVLLDDKISAAAAAPATLDNGLTGALVVTYQALAPVNHSEAALAVFDKLQTLRDERKLGLTGNIPPTEQIMLDAARRIQAGEPLDDIAETSLQASVDVMGRPFTMWTLEVHDLDNVVFPKELLTTHDTYVGIAVATRKLPRSAWGSTVVLMLGFIDEKKMAAASPVSR